MIAMGWISLSLELGVFLLESFIKLLVLLVKFLH